MNGRACAVEFVCRTTVDSDPYRHRGMGPRRLVEALIPVGIALILSAAPAVDARASALSGTTSSGVGGSLDERQVRVTDNGHSQVRPHGQTSDSHVAVLILGEDRQGQRTSLYVGQRFRIPDFSESDWNVSFRAAVLQTLDPPDRMKHPGAQGWSFRVIAPGTTEIVLEGLAPPCPLGSVCPANPKRLVYPIEALPAE